MSIEEVVDMDQWLDDVREKYQEMPVAVRKGKRIRRKPRSPEEERTLILACKKAWDEWIASGELVETKDGYKLCYILILNQSDRKKIKWITEYADVSYRN